MEVDISKKVNYFIKYGVLGLVVLAVLCSGAVWFFYHHQTGFTVRDAQVSSSMIGARTKAAGTVEQVMVADGDRVEAGDVIARIKVNVTDEQIAQLEQTVELSKKNLAEVQKGMTVAQSIPAPAAPSVSSGASQGAVAAAAKRMDRMNQLYEMGAISAVKRDEAEAAYQSALASASSAPSVSSSPSYQTVTQPSSPEVIKNAELQVKQAEAALENAKKASEATEITAPAAGTVYLSDIQEGTEVKAGQTIANIGDAGNLWLEAYVTQAQKDKIRLGQFVSYKIGNAKLQGTVTDILDPQDDSSSSAAGNAANSGADSGTAAADGGSGAATVGTNTEGAKPVSAHPDKVTIRISLPVNASKDLKPGQKADVQFAGD